MAYRNADFAFAEHRVPSAYSAKFCGAIVQAVI
jgi:hypothetical protein